MIYNVRWIKFMDINYFIEFKGNSIKLSAIYIVHDLIHK